MVRKYHDVLEMEHDGYRRYSDDILPVGITVAFPNRSGWKVGAVTAVGRKNAIVRHWPLSQGSSRLFHTTVPVEDLWVLSRDTN
jgi:hypothetical protein